MLNFIVEKGPSKDCDQSKSRSTWPRAGTPTRFVQRSRLDFWLVNIYIYNRHAFLLLN